MLPGGADPFYREIRSASHLHYVRVEVWSGTGEPLAELIREPDQGAPDGGLVFLRGSQISATLTSQVSRNLSLQVPEYLYPEKDDDLLAPMGNEIRVWLGTKLADGALTYVWQVFQGKIQDAVEPIDASGVVTITAADPAQDVLDAQFVNPHNSVAGADLNSEFERVVRGGFPRARFGPSDQFTQPMPALSWEFDRGSAIEEMFSSVGAIWYTLADGRFVVRRYPWTVPGSPVITISDRPGGEILRSGRSRSRSSLFNVVTATGERLNGDAPVTATASDTNLASPTYIGGNFGVRSLLMRRQTPSTQGGVQGAAEARLRTTIAPTRQWSWAVPVDASLELGDVVGLDAKGQDVIQVVQSFNLPLDPGEMIVQGRSQVIGQVEGGL